MTKNLYLNHLALQVCILEHVLGFTGWAFLIQQSKILEYLKYLKSVTFWVVPTKYYYIDAFWISDFGLRDVQPVLSLLWIPLMGLLKPWMYIVCKDALLSALNFSVLDIITFFYNILKGYIILYASFFWVLKYANIDLVSHSEYSFFSWRGRKDFYLILFFS